TSSVVSVRARKVERFRLRPLDMLPRICYPGRSCCDCRELGTRRSPASDALRAGRRTRPAFVTVHPTFERAGCGRRGRRSTLAPEEREMELALSHSSAVPDSSPPLLVGLHF